MKSWVPGTSWEQVRRSKGCKCQIAGNGLLNRLLVLVTYFLLKRQQVYPDRPVLRTSTSPHPVVAVVAVFVTAERVRHPRQVIQRDIPVPVFASLTALDGASWVRHLALAFDHHSCPAPELCLAPPAVEAAHHCPLSEPSVSRTWSVDQVDPLSPCLPPLSLLWAYQSHELFQDKTQDTLRARPRPPRRNPQARRQPTRRR